MSRNLNSSDASHSQHAPKRKPSHSISRCRRKTDRAPLDRLVPSAYCTQRHHQPGQAGVKGASGLAPSASTPIVQGQLSGSYPYIRFPFRLSPFPSLCVYSGLCDLYLFISILIIRLPSLSIADLHKVVGDTNCLTHARFQCFCLPFDGSGPPTPCHPNRGLN